MKEKEVEVVRTPTGIKIKLSGAKTLEEWDKRSQDPRIVREINRQLKELFGK